MAGWLVARARCSRFTLLVLYLIVLACAPGDKPEVDTMALPAVGEKLDFSFQAFRGEPVTSAALRGRAAVIALWVPFAPSGDSAMAQFDSLMIPFSRLETVDFVVLARTQPVTASDRMPRGPWVNRADRAAFAPNANLVFERPSLDPNGPKELKFPSFVMIDGEGRVISRVQGMPYAALRPVLDSIEAVERRATELRAIGVADSMRPLMTAAFEQFDPESLRVDGLVGFDFCSDEGNPTAAVVPAAIRLLSLTAMHVNAVSTHLEVASVGHQEGEMCGDTRAPVIAPRLSIDTVKAIAWLEDDGRWMIRGFSVGPALLSANDPRTRFKGTTRDELRALIDSVRRAGKP
jgi:hypothetical protein